MSDWIGYAAWQHTILGAYLWFIEAVPLGNWNRQKGERLVPALLHGRGMGADDLGMLAFVSLPAFLCWLAYRRRSVWAAAVALLVDAVWMWMQVKTWWVPYVSGSPNSWQLAYARGSTTKLLPSFGSHVAPDGMHFVIHVLLVIAMVSGVLAVWQLARQRSPTRAADL